MVAEKLMYFYTSNLERVKKNLFFRKLFLFVVQINICVHCLNAQPLSFRHLDVNDGLATNVAALVCFDRNGSLWFSTGEAINLYDGNNITQFHWKNNPFIPQSECSFLSVDSYNRVWASYGGDLIMIDEKRRAQRYYLADSLKELKISNCFEIVGLGMVAFTNKGCYYTNDIDKNWTRFLWMDSVISKRPAGYVNRFDSSTIFLRKGTKLFLANLKTRSILFSIDIPEAANACRISDDEILLGLSYKWLLYRISLSQKKIVRTYSGNTDQSGKPIMAELLTIQQAANNKVYIATRYSGLVEFNPSNDSFFVHRYDFYSKQSISTDNLRYLATNRDGYLVVTSRAGLNITNVFQPSFTSIEYFKEPGGRIIDDGVVSILQDKTKKLWVMTQNELFTWRIGDEYVKPLLKLKDIPAIEIFVAPGLPDLDPFGRIWVSYMGYGIIIFDEQGNIVKELREGNESKPGNLPDDVVRVIRQLKNGKMMMGTTNGVFIMDPLTYKIDSVGWRPLIEAMLRKRIVDILEDGKHIWLTTSPAGAVYKYDTTTGKIDIYSTREGVVSLRNYLLARDKMGNVYASSFNGVSVISPGGKLKRIDEKTGLTDLRVEAIVTDDSGYVWMTNTSSLIRYNPVHNQFDYFNEQHGINKTGFQITPVCKTESGELIFGLNRGIVIVDPNQVKARQLPVRFSIYRTNIDNSIEFCSGSSAINLPYSNGKVSFSYLHSDLISGNRLFYRYKMEGIDTAWSTPTKNHLIAYNLRPGNYKFQMQASYNETNWINFPETVRINVAAPFWQQWWFYALIGIIAVSVTTVVYKYIQSSKTQKRKLEQLNRMMNESRLMAIRSQMNPHFIFNSLNAIQESIVMQDFDTAYQYLSKFSKLLRQVLNNSEKDFIPLKDEIEVNQLYLELESLRFKRSFNYSLSVEDNIDPETIRFPSLLLQPFIENAIWHGLMHKQGEKKLDISFFLENNHLECVIEDNGIGREKSAEIKKNKLGSQYFESKGTKLSGQRIHLLNETGHAKASIRIDDLKNERGEAKGTKVTLKLPLDYKP